MIEWITLNPHTKEGIVVAPPVPAGGEGFIYDQALEWGALRRLMVEVRDAGGGDKDLNSVYIKCCESYCNKWLVKEPEAAPEPPPEDHAEYTKDEYLRRRLEQE